LIFSFVSIFIIKCVNQSFVNTFFKISSWHLIKLNFRGMLFFGAYFWLSVEIVKSFFIWCQVFACNRFSIRLIFKICWISFYKEIFV
jgi:hypothetical protein